MAVPSFRPGDYEKLPKWQKIIYWVGIVTVITAIAWLLITKRPL